MTKWTVPRGGSVLTILAQLGSGLVEFDVTPADKPFRADPDTIEEIRVKFGAASGVAQGVLDPGEQQ